jgi:PAS domain S-box-containing protein
VKGAPHFVRRLSGRSCGKSDFSVVKAFFDRLRTEEGVTDFIYFGAHPEAVIECAAGVRVMDVNKAAMKLLNAQRKEQLLGDLNEIVSPETNRAFLEQLVAIASGCIHYAFEGPNRALNGEIRLISGFWSVWPGYENTLSNVTVSIVDLTERKHAEAALAESEQRFRQLVAATPDAVVVIDPSHPVNWKIVDCNEAACQMNGYTRQEMIGQSIDLLNNTVGTPHERAAYLASLRREGVVHLEAIHKHKDGHIFPVEISTTLFTLEGRELILGIDRDITERKQAEEALRLSEERFQLVTHATNDAVWDLDLSTGQQWWNVGVRPLFGYTSEQITTDQAWWEDKIHPQDRPKVLTSFQAALTGDDQFWSKEYRFRRADGTYAYVFDRGYIMQDGQGLPVRVIGAMMDLSERKRMEEALIKSEELFSKAFHASPAPMAITRVDDGVFIDVNGSWERLLIFSRQAVIGHSILDFNIYTDAHERAEMIQRVREQGRLDDFEIKVKTSAGEERDLVVSAQTVEIQGQNCLLSTFYDITELRKMHEAMLASQKLADLGTLAARGA